jgi:Flp pilus assembly protein TadG
MKTKRNQKGQTLVESALVILVLIATLLGIVDFGQVLFFHQSLGERARAGVRWAAVVSPLNADQVKNFVVYNNSAGTGPPVLGGMTTAMVDVVQSGTQGCDEARITITISNYPFQFFSPWIAKTFVNRPIVETLPWEAPAVGNCG